MLFGCCKFNVHCTLYSIQPTHRPRKVTSPEQNALLICFWSRPWSASDHCLIIIHHIANALFAQNLFEWISLVAACPEQRAPDLQSFAILLGRCLPIFTCWSARKSAFNANNEVRCKVWSRHTKKSGWLLADTQPVLQVHGLAEWTWPKEHQTLRMPVYFCAPRLWLDAGGNSIRELFYLSLTR